MADSYYDKSLESRLKDPEFRDEFERERRTIKMIDDLVRDLDDLRQQRGMTKAALARAIGKNPASIRRLLTASGNPELGTIAMVADALDMDVRLIPRASVA